MNQNPGPVIRLEKRWYLAFRDEHRNRLFLPGRESKVGETFGAKLVPYHREVAAFEEVNLVCHGSSAVALVTRILQVPTRLGSLHKAPDGRLDRFPALILVA